MSDANCTALHRNSVAAGITPVTTEGRRSWCADDASVALRDATRRFLQHQAVPHQDRWAQQRAVDRDIWRTAGDLGLLCLAVPAAYGGGGGRVSDDLVVVEELARIDEPGFGIGTHSAIVAPYLVAYGSDEQKLKWLPRLASGEAIATIAVTEPGAVSDVASLTTRADPVAGGYVVNGAKSFVVNGGSADLVLLAAQTDVHGTSGGVSLLLVEATTPGFYRGRVLSKMGQHSADTAELFFDDMFVSAECVLGLTPGAATAQLNAQLPQQRLLSAVFAAVSGERAVELAVEYTQQAHTFGRHLFDLQHVRFELAECATLVRVARSFTDDCVDNYISGTLGPAAAAMAKYWVTEVQGQVVDRCLQIFGDYGYLDDYPISRMYTNARAQRLQPAHERAHRPLPGATRLNIMRTTVTFSRKAPCLLTDVRLRTLAAT